MISGVDTLIWQSFASVIIPGKVIHMIVKWNTKLVNHFQSPRFSNTAYQRVFMNPTNARFFPVAMGLLSIPFIIKPIDHSVEWCMNYGLRNRFYVI